MANPWNVTGDDAVAMQKAIYAHGSFEDSGVADTPDNREYFRRVEARFKTLEPGMVPDIPFVQFIPRS
jgi:hypothetical protein